MNILEAIYEVKSLLLEGLDKESAIEKIVIEFRLNEKEEKEVKEYFKSRGVV